MRPPPFIRSLAPSLRRKPTTEGTLGPRYFPSPYIVLKGPAYLLRAPRAAGARTRRYFSSSKQQKEQKESFGQETKSAEEGQRAGFACEFVFRRDRVVAVLGIVFLNETDFWIFVLARLRKRLAETPIVWYPIPISLGIVVIVAVNFYKGKSWQTKEGERKEPVSVNQVSVKGPWQVSHPSQLEGRESRKETKSDEIDLNRFTY